jgi:hypothetical protein
MFDANLYADELRQRLTQSALEAETLREEAAQLLRLAEAKEQVCELLYEVLDRIPER